MKKEPWDLFLGILLLYGINLSSIESSKNTAVLEDSETGVSQKCYVIENRVYDYIFTAFIQSKIPRKGSKWNKK